MKYIYILILLLFSASVEASPIFDTSRLNSCLKNLYVKTVKEENLVGKEFTCDLLLKFASEKWILFRDGYVGLDQGSKYSFLKFTKGMTIPENLTPFKNVTVTFKVITMNESLASRPDSWPSLEVQLLHISPSK